MNRAHSQLYVACVWIALTSPLVGQSSVIDSATFEFPLQVHSTWTYYVQNLAYPGVDWRYTTVVTVQADTIMPNGQTYARFPAMLDNYGTPRTGNIYMRKAGCRVFQYIPQDTVEFTRFDFSAHPGDSISSFPYEPYSGRKLEFSRTQYLWKIDSGYYFGITRKRYFFFRNQFNGWADEIVVDSLGIVYQEDWELSEWYLLGARINGKEYGNVVAVPKEPVQLPIAYSLSSCFPNPFNSITRLQYTLSRESTVNISVFDMLGRQVKVLTHGTVGPGLHEVRFESGSLVSGTYLVRLRADGVLLTQRAVLLR